MTEEQERGEMWARFQDAAKACFQPPVPMWAPPVQEQSTGAQGDSPEPPQ